MFWNSLNHLTLLLCYSIQFDTVQFSSVQLVRFCLVSFSSDFLFNSLINGSILLLNNLTKEKLQLRSTVLPKIAS